MINTSVVTAYERIDDIRILLQEYEQEEFRDKLGMDLSFQSYADEVASLPGDYARPRGLLLLAECDGQAAGCIALRPLGDERCEMKRLFVRHDFRGRGLARKLVGDLIAQARALGYREMMLDTLPHLNAAIALYRGLGFVETTPYNNNPVEGALFFSLSL